MSLPARGRATLGGLLDAAHHDVDQCAFLPGVQLVPVVGGFLQEQVRHAVQVFQHAARHVPQGVHQVRGVFVKLTQTMRGRFFKLYVRSNCIQVCSGSTPAQGPTATALNVFVFADPFWTSTDPLNQFSFKFCPIIVQTSSVFSKY